MALSSQFEEAVRDGNQEKIRQLLCQGEDVNDGLAYSAGHGHLYIVKYLVDVKGANVRDDEDYPLCISAREGYLDIVKFLVEKGADVSARENYALRWSAESGHLDVVKFLLSVEVDVSTNDGCEALRNAIINNYLDVAECLMRYGARIDFDSFTSFNQEHETKYKYILSKINNRYDLGRALCQAATYGDLKEVKRLVRSEGADVHYECDDPVYYAAGHDNLDIVKYLVEQGADIHVADEVTLRRSAERGHLEVVEYLISQGADVSACNNNALMDAVDNKNLDMIRLLIENGADVHARENWIFENYSDEIVRYVKMLEKSKGSSLGERLVAVAKDGNLQEVKYLINKGADVHYESDDPVYFAAANGHLDIVKYLIDKGADIHVCDEITLREVAEYIKELEGNKDMRSKEKFKAGDIICYSHSNREFTVVEPSLVPKEILKHTNDIPGWVWTVSNNKYQYINPSSCDLFKSATKGDNNMTANSAEPTLKGAFFETLETAQEALKLGGSISASTQASDLLVSTFHKILKRSHPKLVKTLEKTHWASNVEAVVLSGGVHLACTLWPKLLPKAKWGKKIAHLAMVGHFKEIATPFFQYARVFVEELVTNGAHLIDTEETTDTEEG
jgi:ankyrin repeat protein